MTPEQCYQSQLGQEGVISDPAQAAAIGALQQIYLDLLKPLPEAKPAGFLEGLLGKKRPAPAQPITGLYLWGGVGRGKTWLVDIFYNQLPFERKLRLHFHHFMRDTHSALTRLKGQKNPLELVAQEFAERARVICLDEFIVTDIGDAMILAQLLDGLFRRGVTLITTSNTEPDNLYKNGLQRSRFVPAIELLKRHTRVMHLDSATDYRLRYLEQATVYHTPLTPEVEYALIDEFRHLAPEEGQVGGKIELFGRSIPVKRLADDVVWFDFFALCGPPRSQSDYLELARTYHSVILSDIPVLSEDLDDATRRFLYLVDEFYDRGVKLIISAATWPSELYQGERLAFDFQRAVSRLQEMQSKAYLAREHKV